MCIRDRAATESVKETAKEAVKETAKAPAKTAGKAEAKKPAVRRTAKKAAVAAEEIFIQYAGKEFTTKDSKCEKGLDRDDRKERRRYPGY